MSPIAWEEKAWKNAPAPGGKDDGASRTARQQNAPNLGSWIFIASLEGHDGAKELYEKPREPNAAIPSGRSTDACGEAAVPTAPATPASGEREAWRKIAAPAPAKSSCETGPHATPNINNEANSKNIFFLNGKRGTP